MLWRNILAADTGRFLIPPPPNEGALVQEMTEHAATNPQKPGEWWARVEATREQGGTKRVGHRVYHLDLNRGVLEVIETWEGQETGRRTVSLDEN